MKKECGCCWSSMIREGENEMLRELKETGKRGGLRRKQAIGLLPFFFPSFFPLFFVQQIVHQHGQNNFGIFLFRTSSFSKLLK